MPNVAGDRFSFLHLKNHIIKADTKKGIVIHVQIINNTGIKLNMKIH